jgi:hypothetical protein
MTKAELHERIESMTDEEAAEVKLIFAPDWPSKATSIEEIRKRTGTKAMSPEQSEKFWRECGPLMQPPTARVSSLTAAAGSPRFALRVDEKVVTEDLAHATNAARAAIEPAIQSCPATQKPATGRVWEAA